MIPNLSLFVTKEKYHEKKAQVIQLTNQNQQLVQELAESNRQFREVEKELKQLLDIFSTFDITKEEGERLLRKAKNYAQKIQILEERVKGFL
jgi:chromosome segregation ATPase